VEKKAAAKGVVLQSVKEVLQSLVDDSMVHQEKIGTQNIFWSFPSEVGQALKAQLSQYEQQLLDLETRRREAEGRVEAQSAGKEDSDERSALVQAVEELRAKDAALKAELADYKDNDPETLKQLLEAAKVARESANRWTDNIWCLQSWVSGNAAPPGPPSPPAVPAGACAPPPPPAVQEEVRREGEGAGGLLRPERGRGRL